MEDTVYPPPPPLDCSEGENYQYSSKSVIHALCFVFHASILYFMVCLLYVAGIVRLLVINVLMVMRHSIWMCRSQCPVLGPGDMSITVQQLIIPFNKSISFTLHQYSVSQ